MPKAPAPYVTKAQIEQYLALHEERKELNRRAAALDKQAEVIEDQLVQFVECNGGNAKSCTRSGYVLAMLEKAGTVSWKKEFVRVASADAAEKLIKDAPPKEYLSVQKVA